MLFFVLLFLHISVMFAGVALAYGGNIYLLAALRGDNSQGVRAMTQAAKAVGKFVPVLFLSAGLFGLLTAIVNGYNLLTPWLIIAYVLFAVLTVLGAGFTAPTIERLGEAVATAPDGALPDGVAVIKRRYYWIEVFEFGFLFLVIFDMVVKPFS